MFNFNSNSRPHPEHPSDPRLTALLQEWRGIEPSPTFEASVWRRIRSAAVKEQPLPGLWAVAIRSAWQAMHSAWQARGWLRAETVWTPTLAAAGLVLGVSLALALPQPRSGPDFAVYHALSVAPLINSRTLAGAYLTVTSGGIR
ncbi:MAG: hypothetical protein HYV35_07915 [Lentisphaerae bacterium]|nr:hypothetical protein [Lentisphaerota bacterium]